MYAFWGVFVNLWFDNPNNPVSVSSHHCGKLHDSQPGLFAAMSAINIMSVVAPKEFVDNIEQDIESIAEVALTAANERLDAALVRLWAVRPGDVCQTCEMAQMCPKRDMCLHLLAEKSI